MSTTFTKIVQSLPNVVPFVGPETLERGFGRAFKARLGANESSFGISPLARQAIRHAAGIEGCSWYGDPENHELRSTLAQHHNVPISNICVDSGIDSLLGLTIRLFVEPGDCVVTSKGAYPTVNYHVNGYGGKLQTVPYYDHHENPQALADAAHQHGARLVYLANPDNPMGTSISAASIETLLEGLPDHCVLMLDEAYVEFMTSRDALRLNTDDPRLIRYRTFSKAYGMAGMRIGYVLAHENIVSAFNKIRNHFGVNRLAQLAASASLQDTQFLIRVIEQVQTGRRRIYDLADSLGLPYLPSDTNFVAVDMGSAEQAEALISSLGEQGVFMRKPMVPPQDSFIRIGIGTDVEHAYMASVLKPLVENLQR